MAPGGVGAAHDLALRGRLLRDIQELMEQPYPGIRLHSHEDNVSKACLILTPDGPEGTLPLHLTVDFGPHYPMRPPSVTIQTEVVHPNVFDGYICASILNTTEGYTPAYTLKGIAIQLLSFFGSDRLEQSWGSANLAEFRAREGPRRAQLRDAMIWGPCEIVSFTCSKCNFDLGDPSSNATGEATRAVENLALSHPSHSHIRHQGRQLHGETTEAGAADGMASGVCYIDRMPNEVLLDIISHLDFEKLTTLARAWSRISELITHFDVIRQRELQCFVLKKTYHECDLGIGVWAGRGKLQSEFDLISDTAFTVLRARRSVQGLTFAHWLPLPLSRRHWNRVRSETMKRLASLQEAAQIKGDASTTLFVFMNDVIVRLNDDLNKRKGRDGTANPYTTTNDWNKSTLRHASEKAIESYFHLFHLLLCQATDENDGDRIVRDANRLVANFSAGQTSKGACPNLGHLLIALLLSDAEVTQELRKKIIREAITRNVVWMLDVGRGAGAAELAYLEPDDQTSEYRLRRTFEASLTSYRLLMFSELFRRTARPDKTRTLAQVRDELFDRHGAPPRGAAAALAEEARRLQLISSFPEFLREMGVAPVPAASSFCQLLRLTIRDSMSKGYSSWGGLSQEDLRILRLEREPRVGRGGGEAGSSSSNSMRVWSHIRDVGFFPGRPRRR